jgi:hypothetical protein
MPLERTHFFRSLERREAAGFDIWMYPQIPRKEARAHGGTAHVHDATQPGDLPPPPICCDEPMKLMGVIRPFARKVGLCGYECRRCGRIAILDYE